MKRKKTRKKKKQIEERKEEKSSTRKNKNKQRIKRKEENKKKTGQNIVQHPDAAALTVLGGVLRNGFLHRAIREQGGAYGGGASQDSGIAAFHFYSTSFRSEQSEQSEEILKDVE